MLFSCKKLKSAFNEFKLFFIRKYCKLGEMEKETDERAMKKILAEDNVKGDFAADVLWSRKDLMLVVPGSLPCMREMYLRAMRMHALHQFRSVPMRNEDYVLGTAEEKLRHAVREAAQVPGVSVVVIYLSCLDILIRIDFDDLEARLSEETGRIVRCFFRGPLAKTDGIRHPSARELLDALLEEESCIEECGAELPPPMADAAGVSDWLRIQDAANVLITPAGCRSSMRDSDMSLAQRHVYYTEPKREDYIFGMEERAGRDALTLVREGGYRKTALIGTAVPAFLGFAEECLPPASQALYFPCDGFHDALFGVSMGELMLAKRRAAHFAERTRDVLVVGASELLSGSRESFAPCIEALSSLGCRVKFSGEDDCREKPALVWCVSSAGIAAASWLNEAFGIPMLISYPVGAHALSMWGKKVSALIEAESGGEAIPIHQKDIPVRHEERLLFFGDPVMMMGIAHAFRHEGYENMTLASYAWQKETETLCRAAPGGERFHFIRTKEELAPLWEAADIVISDPLLKQSMGEKPMLPAPWGLLSGRKALETPAWLGREISEFI